MATETRRKPRSARRVDGDGKASTITRSAQHRGATKAVKPAVRKIEAPEGAAWEITCQASELVPVAQYANVTIGPVAVTRRVLDTGDIDDLKTAIQEVQQVIYEVIAEDRESVLEEVRRMNEREAESSKKQRNGR